MNWNQAEQTFVDESRELLREIEEALVRIESGDGEENVNTIFLAVHTIREAAEFFRFTQVASFAHGIENLLGKMRNYEIKLAGKWITSLSLCCDHLRGLINHLEYESTGNPDAGISDMIEYFTSGGEMAWKANHRASSVSVAGQFVN